MNLLRGRALSLAMALLAALYLALFAIGHWLSGLSQDAAGRDVRYRWLGQWHVEWGRNAALAGALVAVTLVVLASIALARRLRQPLIWWVSAGVAIGLGIALFAGLFVYFGFSDGTPGKIVEVDGQQYMHERHEFMGSTWHACYRHESGARWVRQSESACPQPPR